MPMYQWNHIEGSPMPVFFYRILQYTYHHNTNIPISTFTTTSSYDNITIRYGYLRGPLNPNPSPVVTRRGGSLCGIDFGFGEPRDWGRCLQVRGWVGVHAWERSAYSLPTRGGIYQSIQKDRSCAFPLTVSSACSPIHQSIHLTHAPPQQSHIYIHLHTSTYIYILILTYHSYLNRRATRYGTGTSVQMAVYMAVHTWLSEGPGNVHHSVDSKIRQIVHRYVSNLSY